jgi:hypothetical protein
VPACLLEAAAVSCLTATALAAHTPTADSSGFAYCAGAGGVLRVLALPALHLAPGARAPVPQQQPAVLRSLQLDGDLLCLTPLLGLSSPGGPGAGEGPGHGGTSQAWRHPLLLVGAHNRWLHAYCVEQVRGSTLKCPLLRQSPLCHSCHHHHNCNDRDLILTYRGCND